MNFETLQLIAGSISSAIFASATLPMLYKAWRSGDMRSYSLTNLLLNNTGNLIHWLYISSLPFGPLWLLHTFYTVTTLMMLYWYIAWQRKQVRKRGTVRKLEWSSGTYPRPRIYETQEIHGV